MPSPKKRPTPADFDVIFVKCGRAECEAWYGARRTTVTRWLEERGKDRLVADRAAYVQRCRELAKRGRRKRLISYWGEACELHT